MLKNIKLVDAVVAKSVTANACAAPFAVNLYLGLK
jgi:hypothetical protein